MSPVKRDKKFGGGKARAGKNSFPPTPFLFARPNEFLEISVGIFPKKSSDFNQKRQQKERQRSKIKFKI